MDVYTLLDDNHDVVFKGHIEALIGLEQNEHNVTDLLDDWVTSVLLAAARQLLVLLTEPAQQLDNEWLEIWQCD